MYVVNIQTLGLESTSVVLSAAILAFDPKDQKTFKELQGDSQFVKFEVEDQVKNYGKIIDKNTLNFWNERSETVKRLNFIPTFHDMKLVDGIDVLRNYVKNHGDGYNSIIWCRDPLHKMCFNGMVNSLKEKSFLNYTKWRDLKTAIDCLYNTNNGSCEVDCRDFDKSMIEYQNPIHDVCFGAMQLMYGVEVDVCG